MDYEPLAFVDRLYLLGMKALFALLKDIFLFIMTNKNDSATPPTPPVIPEPTPTPPQPVTPPTAPPVPSQPYDWSTPTAVRHSVRVLCDEMGMTVEQKNTMCATIGAESNGYNTKALNHNYFKSGKLASTDWGLCQWNDYYHGKEISGGYDGEAMNNPEKAVRLMGHYWKMGELYRCWWIAYKNGSFRHYL